MSHAAPASPRAELSPPPGESLKIREELFALKLGEVRNLRAEILIRIVFQNVVLCVLWCLYGGFLAGAVLAREAGLLVIYDLVAMVAAAMWSHHAARIVQIRHYFLEKIEPELFGKDWDGWERSLATSRIAGLLGSRWFVSTKGVFLGSQGLTLVLFFTVFEEHRLIWAALASCTLLATVWLLRKPRPIRTGAAC